MLKGSKRSFVVGILIFGGESWAKNVRPKLLQIDLKVASSKWQNHYFVFSRQSMALYDLAWPWSAYCGLVWPFMVLYGLTLSSMVFYGIVWLFYGLAWPFYGKKSIWTYMVFSRGHSSKFIWSCLSCLFLRNNPIILLFFFRGHSVQCSKCNAKLMSPFFGREHQ